MLHAAEKLNKIPNWNIPVRNDTKCLFKHEVSDPNRQETSWLVEDYHFGRIKTLKISGISCDCDTHYFVRDKESKKISNRKTTSGSLSLKSVLGNQSLHINKLINNVGYCGYPIGVGYRIF